MSVESEEVEITVEKLQQELRIFFDNDDATLNEWLDLPLPILNGEHPRNMLDSPERRQRLFQILGEMKFGEMA
ncbi:hypothetical protein I533_10220 [Alteromonas mediterranea MED64]|uniref:antitoxin Xre/MbcA/ParS toxin-binding domain-containing protein n=1 Tax=Alteromonas mediterranea TaxID=314275 RepID=UPI0003556012|nr:antitoxin Xre/MbcA/ParS toxin-binding domain-containing protein [Alteromonas mediterranea]AGP82014.1 hypothetical protein I533_10220 [Alteromonas mediterranea MED64]